MKKRTFFLLFTIALLVASALGYLSLQLPKLDAFAQFHIASFNESPSLPVRFKTGPIRVKLFPPRVEIQDVSIAPKEALKNQLKKATIQRVVLEPSLIDLVVGKFWLNRVKLEAPDIEVVVPKQTNSETPDFKISSLLQQIPVSEIFLSQTRLKLNLDSQFAIETQSLYLRAFNQKNSLLAKIKDPEILLTNLQSAKELSLHLDTQFMLTDESISVSKMKVIKNDAYIIGSGNLRFADHYQKLIEGRFSLRAKGSIRQSLDWAQIASSEPPAEGVNGDFKIDLNFSKSLTNSLKGTIDGNLESLQLGRTQLGNLKIKGETRNLETAFFKTIQLNLPGENNIAGIDNIKVDFSDTKDISLSADLNIKHIELHRFLKESRIAKIPVWLDFSGKLHCDGKFNGHLSMECPGKVELRNFKVDGSLKDENPQKKPRNIAKFKKMTATGTALITDHDVSYEVALRSELSEGSSKGTVDFDKGFSIHYDSPKLELSELDEIAEFPAAGTAALSGHTEGNSDYATFNIDIKAKQFEFANYYFGDLSTQLDYLKGTLFFKDTAGNIESTRYSGNFEIDLLAEHIQGDFVLPFLRMKDVQQAVFKQVDLDNRFLGSGSGKLSLNSSLDTDALSFGLTARLFKGSLFGENYDEALIDLVSKEGTIQIDRGILRKEKTKLNLFGSLNMDFESDLQFNITSGNLKSSSLLKELNIPISGQYAAQGTITESLTDPKLKVKAQIEDFLFHKKRYGNGELNYFSDKKSHLVAFRLKNQLQSQIRIPKGSDPRYYFEFDAENFDIAPMVGYSVSEVSTKDYIINFSGGANGYYKMDDFWNSEFSAVAKQISIMYKGNQLKSQLPTNLELKGNKLFLNSFKMTGNDQKLSINNVFSAKFHSKLQIDGRINISFFKLFAPFIKRIDGASDVHLELHIKKNNFRLIGSSFTSGAYVEFPDFPHPFENLTADIIYNQNKVLINSLTGRIAGGKVLGNGEFLFYSPKEFKMKLNMNMDNISLNFPEGYSTTGDAQVSLSGSEAPFLLKGNYLIKKGLVEDEFGGTSEDSGQTSLLSELLKKDQESPLKLDLEIDANQGIAIKNSLAEGDVYGNLKVFDKIEAPKISGKIKMGRSSRLKFQDTEFEITDSQFQFRGKTPINPSIFLTGKTRVQDYDINMLIQGQAEDPKIRLSSQPSLTDRQIVSLLAFGSVNDDVDDELQNGGQQLQQGQNGTSQIQIGTSLLKRNPLGKEITDRLGSGWDIQFSSVIDEGTNLAVPKFTVSKKFPNQLEASLNRQQGERSQTEFKVRYDLGDNMSTVFRMRQQEGLGTGNNQSNLPQNGNLIGVDLEYKKEFK